MSRFHEGRRFASLHCRRCAAIHEALDRHQEWWAFALAAMLFLFLHWSMNVRVFPYDAGEYWALANPSTFFDFPATTRGYFWPLLLLPARWFQHIGAEVALLAFRILTSLVYGFALTIILPAFYIRIVGGRVNFYRRMVVPVLVALLFPGVIVYPLADLPAILLLFGGLSWLVFATSKNQFGKRNLFSLVMAGMMIGAAYNTRTIYLFSMLCVVVAIPFAFFRHEGMKTKAWMLSAFFIGVSLVSLPQALVNLHSKKTFTPMVLTDNGGKSLFALQLMWGITLQRYETVIDPSVTPSRFYVDPAGRRIAELEMIAKDKIALSNYFAIVRKYPVEFAGIYVRHFFNGLDLRDGEVYVRDAKSEGNIISLLNFLVVLAALYGFFSRRLHCRAAPDASAEDGTLPHITQEKSPWIWIGIILLPVIAIIPGAVETRFFLPLQLLFYCSIAFNVILPDAWKTMRLRKWFVWSVLLVMLASQVAITSSTMGTRQYASPDMYR